MNRKIIGEAIYIRVLDRKLKSDSHKMWKCATAEMDRKIRCFHYGERSDVRQQQDVNSRRTAEESRTIM